MPVWLLAIAVILLLIVGLVLKVRSPTELEKLQQEVAGLIREERFEEALPIAERAVDVAYEDLDKWTRDLGEHHTNLIATGQVAGALQTLAIVHQGTQNSEKVEDCLQRAVSVLESAITQDLLIPEDDSTPPPPHPGLADALGNLASFYFETERFDQAASTYRRVVDTTQAEYGADDPILAASLVNLAAALYHLGEPEQGEATSLRAIALLEPVVSEDRLFAQGLVFALNNLGKMYKESGKLEESRATFQKAHEIAESYLEEEDPMVQEIKSPLEEHKRP